MCHRHSADMSAYACRGGRQVYIPFVNYLLMCLCIIIILAFQTSNRLGQAYGVPTHLLLLVCMKAPAPSAQAVHPFASPFVSNLRVCLRRPIVPGGLL
jgi:K+ transporter